MQGLWQWVSYRAGYHTEHRGTEQWGVYMRSLDWFEKSDELGLVYLISWGQSQLQLPALKGGNNKVVDKDGNTPQRLRLQVLMQAGEESKLFW